MAALGKKAVNALVGQVMRLDPKFPGSIPPRGELPVIPETMRKNRAEMTGHTIEAYRGTRRPTQLNDDLKKPRFFSKEPADAETYLARDYVKGSDLKPFYIEGGHVIPAKLNLGTSLVVNADGRKWSQLTADMVKNPVVRRELEKAYPEYAKKSKVTYELTDGMTTDTIASFARKYGFDSVTFKNIRDQLVNKSDTPAGTVYAVFPPENIRSKHAQFSYKNRKMRDLLASATGAVGLGAGAASLNPTEGNS